MGALLAMTMAAATPLTLGASVPSAGSEAPEFTLPSREARWSGGAQLAARPGSIPGEERGGTWSQRGQRRLPQAVLRPARVERQTEADTDYKVTPAYDSRIGMGAAKLARH